MRGRRFRVLAALGTVGVVVVTVSMVPPLARAAKASPPPAACGASAPAGSSVFQATYKQTGQSFSSCLAPSSIATFVLQPGSNNVNVWETETTNGSLVNVNNTGPIKQPNVKLGTASPSLPTVKVDPSVSMQTIDGFGGAMTQSSAELINIWPTKKQILKALFGSKGADLNIARVPMGASDMVTGPIYQGDTSYSYDDNGGASDPTLAHFSIGTQSSKGAAKANSCSRASTPGEFGTGDYADTIPALLCAKSLNPALNLLATPWSAPGWMKINDPTVPSSCSGSDDYLNPSDYGAYTKYFAKFVQDYEEAGLPISEVSMQNEPENCNITYPTMEMAPSGELAPSNQATFTSGSLSGTPPALGWRHRGPGDHGLRPQLLGGR